MLYQKRPHWQPKKLPRPAARLPATPTADQESPQSPRQPATGDAEPTVALGYQGTEGEAGTDDQMEVDWEGDEGQQVIEVDLEDDVMPDPPAEEATPATEEPTRETREAATTQAQCANKV